MHVILRSSRIESAVFAHTLSTRALINNVISYLLRVFEFILAITLKSLFTIVTGKVFVLDIHLTILTLKGYF